MGTRGIILKVGRKKRGSIPRKTVRKIVAAIYAGTVDSVSISPSRRSVKTPAKKKSTSGAVTAK
jgi:hypothetical protein